MITDAYMLPRSSLFRSPNFHVGTGQRGSRPMLLLVPPNELPLHPVTVTTSNGDANTDFRSGNAPPSQWATRGMVNRGISEGLEFPRPNG